MSGRNVAEGKMTTKKRKSLVGWVDGYWDIYFEPNGKLSIEPFGVYRLKPVDKCGYGKPTKVRITVEEITGETDYQLDTKIKDWNLRNQAILGKVVKKDIRITEVDYCK
jgi:hypothetical protein